MSKPNILVLMIDCLRHDRAVGEAGGSVIPTLTELREAGTCFDTTIATVSCTTPSVAAMLTGLYPPKNGVLSMRGYRLKKDVVTLAQCLGEAGYHCRAEMTGPLIPEVGLDRGFHDHVFRDRSRTIFSPFLDELKALVSGKLPEPWFLFVHVWALHRPRKIRREFKRKAFGEMSYDRALTSIDPVLDDILKVTPTDDTIVVLTGDHGERMQKGDLSRQAYCYVSRFPGLDPLWNKWWRWKKMHLPKQLKKLWRIQGEGAYHGFHIYDYLVKVPLFFSGGPFPAGLRVPDQVRHVDMTPTLLDAVGVENEATERMDGRSLLPFARGETLPPAPAYMEATGLTLKSKKNWILGIRTEEWKYARRLEAGFKPDELYDLKADPDEKTNVAPDHPEIVGKLDAEIEGIHAGAAEGIEKMSGDEMKDLDKRLRALGYLD